MSELLSPLKWRKVVSDFDNLCAYCQERPYEEIDHFIPRTRGGIIEDANCLPACTICNKKKSNKTGDALIGIFGKERIEYLRRYLEIHSGTSVVVTNLGPIASEQNGRSCRLRIDIYAEKLGFNQVRLAQRSGVSKHAINRYWNNHMMFCDLDELEKIAVALNVRIGDLLVSDHDPKKEEDQVKEQDRYFMEESEEGGVPKT